MFRQAGDWFVAASPSLTWERGALVQLMIKPMAIDPLFWEIVGLPENRKLPLSFRTTGAWVLRPATLDGQVGHDIGGLEPLADAVLSWVVDRSNEVLVEISVETMLAALPDDADLRGQTRALAICLRILANDLDGAMRLCRVREPDAHPLSRDGGGFTTGHPDGSTSTFLDQARDWIVSRRRSALSLARR